MMKKKMMMICLSLMMMVHQVDHVDPVFRQIGAGIVGLGYRKGR